MSIPMAMHLAKFFREKMGINLVETDKLRLKIIEKTLKKGAITSDHEYEILQDYIEEIYADPDRNEEINWINKLLANFNGQRK